MEDGFREVSRRHPPLVALFAFQHPSAGRAFVINWTTRMKALLTAQYWPEDGVWFIKDGHCVCGVFMCGFVCFLEGGGGVCCCCFLWGGFVCACVVVVGLESNKTIVVLYYIIVDTLTTERCLAPESHKCYIYTLFSILFVYSRSDNESHWWIHMQQCFYNWKPKVSSALSFLKCLSINDCLEKIKCIN